MKHDAQIKQAVQQQFSRNANKYVTSESHAKGDDLLLLLEWAQPEPTWTALDIATGGGHVAKTVAPHCAQVVATDLTRTMLLAAAELIGQSGIGNVMYVVSDAESLPFLDHSFEFVTCRIAAHHFPNPEVFIGEVARVLRPGGTFILIDNVAPEDEELDRFMNTVEKLRDPSHVRCPSVSEWQRWLRQHGLAEQRARLRQKSFQFPTWVERTASSTEQTQRVEQYLLQANTVTEAYFGIQQEAGRIKTWCIDEWMVLCCKH